MDRLLQQASSWPAAFQVTVTWPLGNGVFCNLRPETNSGSVGSCPPLHCVLLVLHKMLRWAANLWSAYRRVIGQSPAVGFSLASLHNMEGPFLQLSHLFFSMLLSQLPALLYTLSLAGLSGELSSCRDQLAFCGPLNLLWRRIMHCRPKVGRKKSTREEENVVANIIQYQENQCARRPFHPQKRKGWRSTQ